MSDNVLLINSKGAAAGPWEAYDISAGWQGKGSTADAALADVGQKAINAALKVGGAAPVRIPAVYTQLFAVATSVGTVPADEYGTGSPAMVVKVFVA